MSNAENREKFDKAFWHVQCSHNPNKAWIVDNTGEKLSALMSKRTARNMVHNHNQTIAYLKARFTVEP